MSTRSAKRRLIVPLVLSVTVVGAAAAAISTVGACHTSHRPVVDAAPHDGGPDSPLV